MPVPVKLQPQPQCAFAELGPEKVQTLCQTPLKCNKTPFIAIYNTGTLWSVQQSASPVRIVCTAVYDQSVRQFACVESGLVLLCEFWLESLS